MAKRKNDAPTTPWRDMPTYDVGIPRALSSLFAKLRTWHEAEVRTAVKLQYLYERDRYRTRNGRFDMPRWVLEDYDWLGSMSNAQPTRNVVKSRVDAVTALLFSSQPRLEIYAAGAGYEQQYLARARAAALDGTINASRPREQRRLVARSGLISSFAACMPVARNNQVEFQAVDLDRLYWDPHDARDDAQGSPPREMHMVEFLDRKVLLQWYRGLNDEAMKLPDRAAKLAILERYQPTTRTRETSVQTPYDWQLGNCALTDSTDRLRVVHSYRVATSPLTEDGRYVCTAYDGANPAMGIVLIDRPYGRSSLPIVWWSPYPPETGGLVGIGLAAQLVEYQRAIDFSMARGQQRLEEMGWAKVLIPAGTPQSVKDNLTEAGITFVAVPNMDGPIQILKNDALSEHDIAWIQMLIDASGADQGISDVIARGGTTRGANASGVSMFEEMDRQIGRISDIYEAWAQFTRALGDQTLGAIEDAVRYDKAFATHYRDPDGDPMRYDWADESLPTAEYVLEVEEASEWGRTRPARIARMMEGAKLGIFKAEDVAAAVRSSPDIRRLGRDGNAKRRKIERDLAQLMGLGGKPEDVIVTEDDDLVLAVQLASERLADAAAGRAKAETLLRLREYRRQAEATIEERLAQEQEKQAAAAAAAGPIMDPGMAAAGPIDPEAAALDAGLPM